MFIFHIPVSNTYQAKRTDFRGQSGGGANFSSRRTEVNCKKNRSGELMLRDGFTDWRLHIVYRELRKKSRSVDRRTIEKRRHSSKKKLTDLDFTRI